MYGYFIDDWVYEKHYRKLDKIDLSLTQKGITGRKIKMSRLHDLAGSIKECFASGIKTFVAVGNDSTASKVLNNIILIKNNGKERTASFSFSFIPIENPILISKVFGYSTIQSAIDSIAARRTSKIDIGVLNSRHYFIQAAIFPKKCSLGFKSYSISSLFKDHQISVCNINIYLSSRFGRKAGFNISDGIFEAVIAHRPSVSFFDRVLGLGNNMEYIPEAVFPVQSIIIKSKQKTISVLADVNKQLASPVLVEILPKELEIIVGEKFYEQNNS